MLRFWRCALLDPVLLLVFAAATASNADAGKRVALVIGNAAYGERPLLNPIKDAEMVAATLNEIGFDIVVIKKDTPLDKFRLELAQFREQASGAEVALFYFAGHGIESHAKNWLIPVDADLENERELDAQAIGVEEVLVALSGADMRILVLDACRDNPLTRNGKRGLGRMEDDDVLILFAAAPGQAAVDGFAGDNSPFAKALTRRIREPGLAVQDLGLHVRFDVLQATRNFGSQSPHVSTNIKPAKLYLGAPNLRRVDFSAGERGKPPSYTVIAEPELRKGATGIAITVEDRRPAGSRVVFVNNKGVYEGRSIEPTVSDNFLTQIDTGNVPAEFTLTFSRPLKSFTFLLPKVFPASSSGITFPAWQATALSARGEVLATTSQGLLRHLPQMGDNVPSRTYKLTAPAFDGIAAVRFASDPNLNGKPFAAFSTLLIEQITLDPF